MGRVAVIIPVAGTEQTAAAPAGGGFDAAHAALAADRTLQFQARGIEPPPAPPAWLRPLFEFLNFIGPALVYVFWAVLALLVLALLYFIGRELIRIRLPKRKEKLVIQEDWRPTFDAALALLSDVDALAEKGLYDEAVHLLLLRSINDIQGRLPNAVRPALTARDIAALSRLPEAARPAFSRIARAVESSLFGGRSVDRATFVECRQAYEAFAFPQAWAA